MTVKWMMHVPVISTGHLTEETANTEITSDFEGPGGLYTLLTMHGFMCFFEAADTDWGAPDFPEDMLRVAVWAEANGYEWVRFDPDGDRIEELPWYEW